MGMLDGIGDKIAQNADALKAGVDKVGDAIDEKTGGKFADKVDQAQDFAKQQIDKAANKQP
ncbi:antitoxin [Tessaracoccus sp. OH4464_COT-324]|uniref:antitoxin n=1 Tax=Tessaracoccus sp. OH4464_COT-324 TaxID=2491059 RepID=UPI000F633BBA|nr:antitoxin [Tessaracoccus sp. OH4464_COT-324]RRD47484.1 antitoxin [Tessaracoccus sp. OH4464_COT-324]